MTVPSLVSSSNPYGLSCDPSVNGFQLTNSYALDAAGNQMSEYVTGSDGNLDWHHTNVWAGGKLLATYETAGAGPPANGATLHFYLDDPLGTRRVQTDYAGVIEQTCSSLPFGDGETCTPTPTEHLFTGKERDAESGNDYFGARYYASSMGRFLSPDWSAKAEPVPYAKLGDPQSLNLFAYVRNNPLAGVDPDGHFNGCSNHTPNDLCDGSTVFPDEQGDQEEAAATVARTQELDEELGSDQQQNDSSSSATGQDQSHSANVAYYPKGAGGFGHIGIGIDTDNTRGYSTADPKVHWWTRLFGAPAGAPELDIPAHTKNGEAPHPQYIRIPISADQARAMQGAIDARIANPGHYNLLFNNCAQFVESVLHAGGVSGVPHAEMNGPAVLAGILAYENSWR